MARLITCLLLLLAGLGVNAQLWNKTYIDNRPLMYFSSVVHHNGTYHIAGGTRDTNGFSYTRAMLGKIDNAGDLLDYKIVQDTALKNYGAFFNSLLIADNNTLFYTGYSRDSLARILVLKTDINIDSIAVYEYATPNATAFQGYNIMQYDENSYYITGVITTSNNADIVLVKIDTNGNRLWERSFNQYKIDYGRKIIKLSNGNIMIGALRNRADTQPIEYSNTWLLEVDTGGYIVRQWFDPNDSTYAAEGLLQTQDGGFVYGGQKKYLQIGNTVAYTGSITKIDFSFGKQWTFNGGYRSVYTGITDVEEFADGSIVGCGQAFSHENDTTVLYGWIVKLTPTGSVVWERIYTGINTSLVKNYLTDIDVLPDGSLIAVGQCQHPGNLPPQVGWILKLDSNGCEIENCVVGIEPTPKSPSRNNRDEKGHLNSQLQVWPNPFSTDLSLSLYEGEEIIPAATFTITTITGQVVYQQQENNLATGYTKMLELSYLPNGVYFIEVSTAAGKAVQRVVKE